MMRTLIYLYSLVNRVYGTSAYDHYIFPPQILEFHLTQIYNTLTRARFKSIIDLIEISKLSSKLKSCILCVAGLKCQLQKCFYNTWIVCRNL